MAVSLGYLIWLGIRKIPLLLNVKVDNLPDVKAKRQKKAILQNRLTRTLQKFAGDIGKMANPLGQKSQNIFKTYYLKLKDLENDLRRRGHAKLSSAVDRSQHIEDLLTQARQLLNKDEYQQAENALLDTLSIDQYNVEAYKMLVDVYRSRKEYEEAKETLEYLLKLTHNEDAAVYHSLADIARQRGDLRQAEEDYLKSASLAEDNYLHLLSLAEVYLELDDKEQAFETAQKALQLSPNNPKILDFLINLSIMMQDRQEAVMYLDKLVEVNPENNKIEDFREEIDALK